MSSVRLAFVYGSRTLFGFFKEICRQLCDETFSREQSGNGRGTFHFRAYSVLSNHVLRIRVPRNIDLQLTVAYNLNWHAKV